jgi:glycosyltransferase involved in cell wall biosynthesis
MPKLSVVIPAYNEAKRIEPTLRETKKYLDKQKYDYEVLIVNDGSTDNTAEVVGGIICDWDKFKLIDNRKNKGKGGVVKQGMLAAKGSWRLFMDADNSTPVSEVEKFWPYTESYEIIIGSRYSHGGEITDPQPLSRRVMSRLGNFLIQLMVAWGMKDTQCGFKMFSADATKDIFPLQTMQMWSFDIELIAIAKRHRYQIAQVGITWDDAGDSKVGSDAAMRTFKNLFRIKWNLIKGKYNKRKP